MVKLHLQVQEKKTQEEVRKICWKELEGLKKRLPRENSRGF